VELTAHPGPAGYSYQWTQNGINYSASQSITVNIEATYSVKVTNTNGCFASATTSLSTEMVKNGKFDLGNDGSFSSEYTYQPYLPGDTSLHRPEGKYAIGTDPQDYHMYFWGRDHTTNTGNFMIINGVPSSVAWKQQITDLVPGTRYYFSAWAISLNNSTPFAQLQFRINGVQVGSFVTLPGRPQMDNPPYNWLQFYGDWTAPENTTSALLEIIDLQTALAGNDFGLDDISFGTLSPTLMSLAASANGGDPVCEGGTVNLSVSINGGRPPYTFAWTGPNGAIPGVQYPSIANVTTADNGTYTVVINDSYGCTAVSASTTVTVRPTPTAFIEQEGVKVSACLGSAPPPAVTFTGEADAAPYTFTYHINNGADTTTTSESSNDSKSITYPTSSSGDFTYTLTKVTGASGCSQLQTSAKTISIKEVTATISGSTGVCYGAPQPEITFTGSGWGSAPPFTFTYKINSEPEQTAVATAENCISIPVPSDVPGTFVYTLLSVTASGCTQPASGSATVTVSPSPIITGPSSLCINSGNITYSTEAGMTGYIWNITGGTIATGTNTNSVTVNWGATAGAQSISVTYTNNGCTVTTPLPVTLNAYPAITTAAGTADVCFSATNQSTTFLYSLPTGSPTTYSITWNASPANSFVAVQDAALSASPINITVPAGTSPGIYSGTISVSNGNGCVSNGTTFTVTVNALPTTSAIYHQ
jgi:hypothetical protein